jgi:ribosomal-protein-alanine N-acetyltransferase
MFPTIKLASEALTEHYNPSIFNFFYETFNDGFWVAEKQNKIIGFIVGVKTSYKNARILMLAVSEKQRRQHIGSELLNHFLNEIMANNVKFVDLEVKTSNNIAIKFYRKNGFIITNQISGFYQNGEDAYTMHLSF